MRPKLPLNELEQLRLQVRWLEEQLQGHEDQFGKTIDKITGLEDRLEQAHKERDKAVEDKIIEQSKVASLAGYVNAIEDAPLLKILKAPLRRDLRVAAAIAAFEATAYKNIVWELTDLLKTEVPEGEEHALVSEACRILGTGAKIIDENCKKIAEKV